FRTATPPRTESSPQIRHSRKSLAHCAAIQVANNRTAGKSSSHCDIREVKLTPSPVRRVPTHSPKFDSADADCSLPLTPRGFRKSARGGPTRSLPAADTPPPTRQSLRRLLSEISEVSSCCGAGEC